MIIIMIIIYLGCSRYCYWKAEFIKKMNDIVIVMQIKNVFLQCVLFKQNAHT